MNRSTYFVVLLLIGTVLMLVAGASNGQRKGAANPNIDAAKRNALLSTDLTWTFGSKQQKGWYIYTPLIKRLIDTKQDSGSTQFAQAISRWQAKSGLKSSGMLDEETLYAM